ncbi:MAG: hypothetical protein UY22_C0043G0007 [Candidatus Amesbacteria bacterium GW2011_GWC1_48_10]|uniref:Uncharacterized protein n=2 Tax=Patescibacteria group TaxID=1783273 RepID=A0A0G1UB37_9BACT|nr:MAG: hypothetical protein UY22_C0043G0007 [Candidatus Amesbacteria bacterium GW2011_GWC1_48_10]KKW22754.1 MAG: hypothetical protein UY67_C0036G0004 [Candidatus Kaiserbacteria bacterium GW2011_GWA2_52_12]
MKANHTYTIIRIATIGFLLFALGSHPYGYYQFLRWLVTGITVFIAYKAYEQKKNGWAWAYGVTAVLYNPIWPFYLDKDTWGFIDVAAAMMMLVSIFSLKVNRSLTP